jgi:hypothetical protein
MIIPAGFAQVNMLFQGVAAPRGAQVVFGVRRVEPATVTTPIALANLATSLWSAHIRPLQSPSIKLVGARAKFGPNATGPDATNTVNFDGGNVGGAESPQVAVLVRKVTEQGGRTGRGRMFVPGAIDASVNGAGQLAGDTPTAFQNGFTDWLEGWSDALWPVVILHSIEGLAPVTVVAMQVQQTAATQRRRLRKVGGRRAVLP